MCIYIYIRENKIDFNICGIFCSVIYRIKKDLSMFYINLKNWKIMIFGKFKKKIVC